VARLVEARDTPLVVRAKALLAGPHS